MATTIGFYHLTRTPLPEALAKLLGRVLAQSDRALVLCTNPERLAALDAALWLSTDPDWLPHGTKLTGDAAFQPIWLTTEPPGEAGAPNGARLLFLLEGATGATVTAFDRVLDLFDGGDPAALHAARARWAEWRAAGYCLTYWKQGPRGWEKGA